MSLITIISIIIIVLATTDFMFPNMPRLKNDIFNLSFFIIYFLFTIKYYYGPDINTYVPHYEEDILSLSHAINNLSSLSFEPGYNIFCGILKSLGFSFWAMTAIISTLYFTAIYQLFEQLKGAKIFALMILVVMDIGVMYAALRQCLAISMFIFMILALQKNKTTNSIIFALLATLFHKSAIFAIIPIFILFVLQKTQIKTYTFQILLFLLCLLAILPIINIINSVVEFIPLPPNTLQSIQHHLLLGRSVQVVFLVYLTALICTIHFTTTSTQKKDIIKTTVVIGFIFIVLFYQYYYILHRIRSYFLPIIIVYIINLSYQYFENKKSQIPYSNILRQLSVIFMFTYVIFQTYNLDKSYRQTESQIHDCTTIFELKRYNKETIRQRQLNKAKNYWTKDYMKDTHNRIKK